MRASRVALALIAVALLSGVSTWSAAATPTRLPPTGSWGTAALLPAWYVRAAAATGPDGRIYVLGEYAPDQRTVIAYDAPTGTWRRVPSMHVGRLAAAAVQGPDGRIYVLGGLVAGKSHDTWSRAVEAYSVITHRWTTLAPMLRPRAYLAAALGGDGRIYAVGGEQNIGQGVSVEAYNIRSNSWATVPSPPLTGTSVSAVGGPDGRIYLMGGVDPSRSDVVAYDPKGGTWIQRAPMPRLGFEIGVTLGPNGWIYAVGGSGDDTAANLQSQTSVEAYDATSDRWVELPPLPQPRAGAAVAALPDGRIFAVAGYDRAQSDSVASLNVDVFTPTGLTTPTPAPTPAPVLSTHARKCNKTYGIQLHARLAVCYAPQYLAEAQRQMAHAFDPRGAIASSTGLRLAQVVLTSPIGGLNPLPGQNYSTTRRITTIHYLFGRWSQLPGESLYGPSPGRGNPYVVVQEMPLSTSLTCSTTTRKPPCLFRQIVGHADDFKDGIEIPIPGAWVDYVPLVRRHLMLGIVSNLKAANLRRVEAAVVAALS